MGFATFDNKQFLEFVAFLGLIVVKFHESYDQKTRSAMNTANTK